MRPLSRCYSLIEEFRNKMASDIQPRLFVTGATGQLGRIVIRELLRRVQPSSVVAGVRSTDHEVAKYFGAQGVEVRVADYSRPDARSPSRARVVWRDYVTPFLGRRTRPIPTRSAIREARCVTGLIALG
jgi:nucleoside-diphosphate-sugar epimerase